MTHPPHGEHSSGDAPGGDRPAPPQQPWGPPAWPHGQAPAGYGRPGDTRPYGAPPFGQAPYGQPPQHRHPGAGGYGPPRYGQPPHGQPQYGQPQSGPPAQYGPPGASGSGLPQYALARPPARTTRTGLLVGLLVLAAVLVGGVVLASTTGPTVLSRSAVERDVAEQFEQREGVAVDLNCDQEMRVEEGATYACTGVTADDEEITLRIEITDAEGARYTWSEP
ncbi:MULTISPECIES: DUF4333 domain-containing protein [unclassified Blastococcus]